MALEGSRLAEFPDENQKCSESREVGIVVCVPELFPPSLAQSGMPQVEGGKAGPLCWLTSGCGQGLD